MQIETQEKGSALVVAISGSLDTKTAPAAETAIGAILDQGRNHLVVDFSEVDYIASSGLRVLLSTMKRLKKSKGKMFLCGMNPTVREVFDISGFSGIFKILDTQADALAAG
ncbi:MAG: anti-sigma factor antagonist [Deltaproteobacteria bacterium]|nr:MAG: anti-sigma factor antagonist [Deltaproteobacteria bacterium]